MRKIIAILTLAVVLAFSYPAFEQNSSREWSQQKHLSNSKGLNAMVKERNNIINNNRVILNNSQYQLTEKIKLVKQNIENVANNLDSLDAKEIENIGEILEDIGEAQQKLSATEGMMQRKNTELRYLKQNQKSEYFLNTLDEIIVVHEKRIHNMNEIITNLDDLDTNWIKD